MCVHSIQLQGPSLKTKQVQMCVSTLSELLGGVSSEMTCPVI